MLPYRRSLTSACKLAHVPHTIPQTTCNKATLSVRNAVEIHIEIGAEYTKIAAGIYLRALIKGRG
jgi:hypothetical protein